MRSLALCIISLSIMPVASGFVCDDGHWVDQVSGQGRIVILEDRSVLAIDNGDQVDAALELPQRTSLLAATRLSTLKMVK